MTPPALEQSSPVCRRQPLLLKEKQCGVPHERRKVGEVAGGTAAECAAICCCCPCTVMNILVLAVYKVPAGLCKKAWNKKKKRRQCTIKKKNKSLLAQPPECSSDGGRTPISATLEQHLSIDAHKGDGPSSDTADLEEEMWTRFAGAGFWRSDSQRAP